MITEQDVYIAYKKAEKEITGKKVRPTNDWERYSKNSISKKDMVYLTKISKYFNTIWSNIEIQFYMECGWKLYGAKTHKNCPECNATIVKPYKDFYECMECGYDIRSSFTYNKFLRPKILETYKREDKKRKRSLSLPERQIQESLSFVDSYLKQKKVSTRNGYTKLEMYCKLKDGNQRKILSHYNHQKVSPLIVVYCLSNKYIRLNDVEKEYCYIIVNKYREYLLELEKYEHIIKRWNK